MHEGCWDPLDTRGLVHSDETDAADGVRGHVGGVSHHRTCRGAGTPSDVSSGEVTLEPLCDSCGAGAGTGAVLPAAQWDGGWLQVYSSATEAGEAPQS